MDHRLQETILKGDVPTFLSLIQENEDIMSQEVPSGSRNTILHLAARLGHLNLAEEIVKLRPEMVSEVNKKMETPLHEACRQGKMELVKLLVESDPWVLYKLNQENENALFVACQRGKVEVVNYLLNFQWLLTSEVDGYATSLHVAALGGYAEIVREIMKIRQDFAWKRDINGCTPLHLACSKGHLETTRELLKYDADLSSLQDNDGRTPLHWAAIKGRVNVIDEVLSVSLEPAEMITKNGETVLHLGVKNNQFDAVKYLMETLNITNLINRPDKDGNTALHLATAGKLSAMVIYLLKLNGDVNVINRKGQTVLDVVESDVSNSGALLILPAIQDAGGKRGDQLPPGSTEIHQIVQEYNPSLPSSPPKKVLDSPNHHHRRKHRRRREKQLEDQSEGLRNARNTITVVSVLIATVTFAAGINPPGGFNQLSGRTIMGKHTSFKVFAVCNVVALFTSLGIVIVLVSIIPFRRKSMMKLLVVTHKIMWVSMSFMAAAYIAAMWTVLPHGQGWGGVWVLVAIAAIGGGCTVGIFMGLGFLLAQHWIRKSEWRKNKDKRKDASPSSSISRIEELKTIKRGDCDSTSNSDVDSSDQGGYHLY
ncbi:ankyrin repeat-containing protein ITN1 [Ricinus communis]|uniref:Ankyrin repeat-containing protein, putative n=1 Tax=Ricinus communis TaxID=3988 RepID=B9RS18_RICCO|nr:ankyrin repeat-containing protein ITN1 [Ricinus communis]EEF45878.1 ankyrin repeat-containing protein, putative [Ricinus communis]|eukprot:XP_002516537.1 ankyrin repeat-containing protein ITN1 [Ricinus communis]